ncbi:MAG: hypothetical protein LBC99_06040 [Spirochaetota bacterium]|nr:hypothetical protein [Spirochaetota bacterium]
MAKKSRDYFGLSWIISLILAIFPPTNIILGICTRIARKNLLMALLNLLLFFIFYFVDLFSMIMHKSIKWLI